MALPYLFIYIFKGCYFQRTTHTIVYPEVFHLTPNSYYIRIM